MHAIDRQATFNVLLSSAGRRVALLRAFRHSLARRGLAGHVFAADSSQLSAAFHDADRGFLVPACDNASFVPQMLELCTKAGVRLVIPTIDTELAVYAANRGLFEAEGITIAVSSPAAVAIAGDKRQTHSFLIRNGLPTVRQGEVTDVDEHGGQWIFPLIAKPAAGSAGSGVAIVPDRASLLTVVGDGDYVVQSKAPGSEYTVDVFADRGGVPRCAVPRRRLEVRAGEVSKGATARLPDVVDLAQAVVARLPGAFGALNVQIFRDDETNNLNIIELNARFGGGFPLAYHAGADFPGWLIDLARGGVIDFNTCDWRSGVLMLRYDDAVFIEPPGANGA